MPETSAQTPKSQRRERSARKLNRKQVVDQHQRGLTPTEIATQQGVARSTVTRFLERMRPEIKAVEEFKHHRADALARLQAKSLDTQERILDSFTDGLLAELTPSQKSSLLMALNAQHGTLFDKERLERGQSTANISAISRMMESRVSTLYKRMGGAVNKNTSNSDEANEVPRPMKAQEVDSSQSPSNAEAGGPGGMGENSNFVDGIPSSAREGE